MTARTKLAAFALALVAIFGAAAAAGATVGPIDVAGDSHASGGAAHAQGDGATTAIPRGLSIAAGGYLLTVDDAALAQGRPGSLSFRIVDDSGDALTDYDVVHERALHLIVVSRDLVGYHHLHPQMDETGRWSTELPGLDAGSYRVFADFQPHGGDQLTLGADVTVPGEVDRADVPTPSPAASVDGYDVTLNGDARVGESELEFTVARDGEPVTPEPYLGAKGHLVAIRAGDFAFLHVHPLDVDGDAVTFAAELPSAGTYRLFLDFSHGGVVRTAAFTVEVPTR
jgi:hypothetical protein